MVGGLVSRPARPVREGEPPFYETRYSYDNPDGLLTRVEFPDGSITEKQFEIALRSDAPPIERARVLAARIELAVAMGDEERARSAREELAAIMLTDEERERYRDEFQAVEAIERLQG